jgi:hypothetical protein
VEAMVQQLTNRSRPPVADQWIERIDHTLAA